MRKGPVLLTRDQATPQLDETRFSLGDRLQIGLFVAAAVPFVALRFLGVQFPPIWTALSLGLAIVGAAYGLLPGLGYGVAADRCLPGLRPGGSSPDSGVA